MWQLRPGVLSRAAVDGAAAGPAPPVYEAMTWNSADKAAGITLYDGDREAWHTTLSLEWVRATKAISTGKYCWALHVDNAIAWRTGIATAAFNLDTGQLGVGTLSVSLSNLGVVLYNSVSLVDYADYAIGDYVLVAFDADAGDIWFGRNGTWNGDPAAGTGAIKSDVAAGTWYPTFGATGAGPQGKVTLVPFPIAAPTGFMPLYPTPSGDAKHWETVHFVLITGSNTGWNGFNLRQVLTAAQLGDKTGTKIRARLKGAATGENSQIDAAYIGYQAGAGDAYDMDGTQLPLTVSASNAFTITVATLTTTDAIIYSYDGSKGLVFSFHFNSAAADDVGNVTAVGYTVYSKSAVVGDTGTANVSTYTTGGNLCRMVQEVQVYVDD